MACRADDAVPARLGWKPFGDERDEAINQVARSAWGAILRLSIDLARKAEQPLDRVAIRDMIHARVGDAIVSSLANFGLLDLTTFPAALCPACGAPDCGSAFCELKRRKAEQQVKAQPWAARCGVTGDARC